MWIKYDYEEAIFFLKCYANVLSWSSAFYMNKSILLHISHQIKYSTRKLFSFSRQELKINICLPSLAHCKVKLLFLFSMEFNKGFIIHMHLEWVIFLYFWYGIAKVAVMFSALFWLIINEMNPITRENKLKLSQAVNFYFRISAQHFRPGGASLCPLSSASGSVSTWGGQRECLLGGEAVWRFASVNDLERKPSERRDGWGKKTTFCFVTSSRVLSSFSCMSA